MVKSTLVSECHSCWRLTVYRSAIWELVSPDAHLLVLILSSWVTLNDTPGSSARQHTLCDLPLGTWLILQHDSGEEDACRKSVSSRSHGLLQGSFPGGWTLFSRLLLLFVL